MNEIMPASISPSFFSAAYAGWVEIAGKEQTIVLSQSDGENFWRAVDAILAEHTNQQTKDGLAMRAGRAALVHFIGREGEALGLTQLDFRLMPTPVRLAVGWQTLAKVCDQAVVPNLSAEVEEGYCLRAETPLRAAQAAFLCGFFQEFLYWASQGRVYPLRQRGINGFCFVKEALTL